MFNYIGISLPFLQNIRFLFQFVINVFLSMVVIYIVEMKNASSIFLIL